MTQPKQLDYRINAKLIKGLTAEQTYNLYRRYQDAEEILKKIRDQIKRDAEEELLELSKRIESNDVSTVVAQVLGRRQGLLKTLTYFPEE